MTSRRVLLAGGAAVLAGVLAACTKAVRGAAPGPTAAPPAAPSAAVASSAVRSASAARSAGLPSVTPDPIASPPPSAAASAAASSPSTRPAASPPASTRRPVPTSNRPSGPADFLSHGPRSSTRVALTFHGQGDPDLARRILAIAADRRVHITVMAVGTWLDDHPEMAPEILAGGHELGNHTWSHGDINSMGSADAAAEITRCRDRLVALTGSPGRYFRQSQSPTPSDEVRVLAGAAGYRTCLGYDVDSLDWTDPGADAVRQATTAATGGSIVSMHLGHQDTIDALPQVLADLAARRLTPVTVSALLA